MRVASIGECMVELSRVDQTGMRISSGGDTLNTAVYLARLGIDVDYVTALGDDPYSQEMLRVWVDEGVGIERVITCPGRLPGLYVIETDARGDRSFYYWRDCAPARELFALPESEQLLAALVDYDCIYVSAISLSLYGQLGRARLFAVLDRARRHGCCICFDSNYRPRGWSSVSEAKAAIAEMLSRTDIALPSLEDEQTLYDDRNPRACAERIASAGVAEVVVKDGASGCFLWTADEAVSVPSPRVQEPVDTTAAGDSFNAAYLAARLSGATALEAAAAGHRLAGQVILHPGAIIPKAAMPSGETCCPAGGTTSS